MRKSFLRLLVVALSLLCTTDITAQDSLSVVLKKAGKLKGSIKKKQVPTLQKLKITGEINSDDIYFLTTLPQIKELDLSEVTLQANDKKARQHKGKYITSKIYKTREEPRRSYYYKERDTEVTVLSIPDIKTLEVLTVTDTLLFKADSLHLKKLTVKPAYSNKYDNKYLYFKTKDDFYSFFGKNIVVIDTIETNYNIRNSTAFHKGKNDENHVTLIEAALSSKFIHLQKLTDEKSGKVSTVLISWNDGFDVSVLAGIDSINTNAFEHSDIKSLRFPDEMQVLPKNFASSWKSLTEVDLNNVKYIGNEAFAGCRNLVSVKADNVTDIGSGAFYGCSKLASININNAIHLGDSAFMGCSNLEKITLGETDTLGSKLFAGTSIRSLTIPATVKAIFVDFFKDSKLEKIEFLGKTPPSVYKYEYKFKKAERKICENFYDLPERFWKIDYTIPQNSSLSYDKFFWREIRMVEKGFNKQTEFELTIENPGNIAEYLTDDILANAETLILKGVLYKEDLLALDMCKHLKVLDLTKTFITLNKEDREREAATVALMAAIIASAAGEVVSTVEKGYSDQKDLYKTFITTYDDANTIMMAANPDCRIPEISGSNANSAPYFKYLEEVRYPIQLNCIERIGKNVKKVVLPRAATQINSLSSQQSRIELPDSLKEVNDRAFTGCPNVEELIFPTSLKYCSGNAFEGCISLRKIDLGNTGIREFDCSGYYDYGKYEPLDNLEEIYFPETLEEVNLKKILGSKAVKIHFKSKSKPNGLHSDSVREIDTVYIPKGCRSGWMDFISNTKATIVEY